MRRLTLIAWVLGIFVLPALAAPAADVAKPSPDKAPSAGKHSAPAKKAKAEPAAKAKPQEAAKAKPQETAKAKPQEAAKAKPPAKAKPAEPVKKELRLVRLTLKGEYPEGSAPVGLFGEMQMSLRTLLERIDQAAEDKDVDAVVLRVESLGIGRGKVNEIRAAVARFRKKGKPIYAELTGADSTEYLMALACDEVFMPSSGMLLIPGLRAEMSFYKNLLDKLGIQFDVLQEGKFKGAGEPYSRASMSKPLRESLEALVDDTYEGLVRTIARDRKLPDYQVKSLIDQGLFTAQAACKAGLIDRVAYFDEFQECLRTRLKATSVKLITDYKKKQIDADFSGIGGMVKLMELLFGGRNAAERISLQRKIAVVYASGVIVSGRSGSDAFGDESLGATTLIQALRTAAEDEKVAAIVLRIDSPGGSAIASDLIWREVVRIKKPLIASMGDVAGSGGYYIAMSAGKIFAEPDTLTGSIGVIGGKLVAGKLLDKIGITTEVISRGKNSGSLSMLAPFSPTEREAWTAMLDETYRQFVSKAAAGRHISQQRLESLAQGRVYTGRMAAANGLVDRLGTLQDAIAEAKRAAHLPAGQKVELLILPKPKSIFEQLFGDSSASADVESILPGIGQIIRQAAFWQRVFAEPRLLLMPCRIELK
jgi:protease-4